MSRTRAGSLVFAIATVLNVWRASSVFLSTLTLGSSFGPCPKIVVSVIAHRASHIKDCAVTSEIRPDWDLTAPGLREAWNAGDVSRFHGWNKQTGVETGSIERKK
jgi:hypothetical protein